MSSIQIKTKVTISDLINGVEQLSNQDLDAFIKNILSVRAKRNSQVSDKEETELLEKINETLANEELERYRILIQKRDEESLSEPEHQELIAVSDKIEWINAKRMESLSRLADLKGISLKEIMKQLEIYPRDV